MNSRRIKMKITIIGDKMSGKSSFITNLLTGKFNSTYIQTNGYQVSIYELKNNNLQYQIHLWQCGAYHLNNNKFLRKAFFRNSSATFLIFDLQLNNWKQSIVKWIQQSYNFQSFLLYAIGTKKNLLQKKSMQSQLSNLTQSKLAQKNSLFNQSHNPIQTQSFHFQQNQFFSQYNIRNFYQSCCQKIPYQIKNIFITINDDKQKLSRSSLVKGSKFQHSMLDSYMRKEKEKDRIKGSNSGIGSVVVEEVEDKIYNAK